MNASGDTKAGAGGVAGAAAGIVGAAASVARHAVWYLSYRLHGTVRPHEARRWDSRGGAP